LRQLNHIFVNEKRFKELTLYYIILITFIYYEYI